MQADRMLSLNLESWAGVLGVCLGFWDAFFFEEGIWRGGVVALFFLATRTMEQDHREKQVLSAW